MITWPVEPAHAVLLDENLQPITDPAEMALEGYRTGLKEGNQSCEDTILALEQTIAETPPCDQGFNPWIAGGIGATAGILIAAAIAARIFLNWLRPLLP